MRRVFVAILGALAVLATFAASTPAISQSLPTNQPVYLIIPAPESNTAFLGSAANFQWIDNERLLFVATDRERSVNEKKGDRLVTVRAVATLHLWDLKAGTIHRYRSEPSTDRLCVVDGRVRYAIEQAGKKTVFEGPFGDERGREPTPSRTLSNGREDPARVNPYSCKEYFFSDLTARNGGRTFPIRDEEGYFERMGSGADGKPRWEGLSPPFKRWIHKEGRSIELAFPQDPIGDPLEYSSFARGYLFRRDERRIEIGVANRVYFLDTPSYSVRSIDILGSQNWARLSNYTVTRQGLVAVSRQPAKANSRWDPGPAGIYLFYGEPLREFLGTRYAQGSTANASQFLSSVRVVAGIVDAISKASPDGCRIGAVVDPWNREDRKIQLQAVDFCSRAG